MTPKLDKLATIALVVSAPLAILSACSSDRAAPPVATGGNGGGAGSSASGGASGSQGGAAGKGGAAAGSAGDAGSGGAGAAGAPDSGATDGAAGQDAGTGEGGASGGAGGADAGTDSADGAAGEAGASVDASVDATSDVSQEAAVEAGVDAQVPPDADPCSLCTAPAGGSVTCVDGQCGFSIEASSVPGFWYAEAGGNTLLSLTDDDRAVVSPELGPVDIIVDLQSHQTKSVASVGGRRIALIIKPPIRYKVGGYESSYVSEIEGGKAYTWGYGCCNLSGLWLAVDAENMIGYQQTIKWDFDSGVVSSVGNPAHHGYTYLADSKTVYEVSMSGYVTRLNTLTQTTTWETLIENWNFSSTTAIGSDMSITVGLAAQSTSLPWVLARVDSTGNVVWKKSDWNLNAHPVLLSSGDIIIGTNPLNADSRAIKRISKADGSVMWTQEPPGTVHDLTVADGNLIYVLMRMSDGSLRVIGVDQTTGKTRYDYTGLSLSTPGNNYSAPEMLLRKGVLYVLASGSPTRLTALPVTAAHYDYASPWPVKLHDNQRTSYRLAPLDL